MVRLVGKRIILTAGLRTKYIETRCGNSEIANRLLQKSLPIVVISDFYRVSYNLKYALCIL